MTDLTAPAHKTSEIIYARLTDGQPVYVTPPPMPTGRDKDAPDHIADEWEALRTMLVNPLIEASSSTPTTQAFHLVPRFYTVPWHSVLYLSRGVLHQ